LHHQKELVYISGGHIVKMNKGLLLSSVMSNLSKLSKAAILNSASGEK
jgi:hypothetical protein